MERDFKGVWIPKEIWLDDRLNALDKIIFVEIDSLCSEERGCFASNKYLAEFCQCSETKISKAISKLIDLEYLYVVSFNGRQRELQSRFSKVAKQPCKKCKAEKQKMQGSIYIDNNNKDNNKNININNAREEKRNFADLSPEFLNQKIDNLSESSEVKQLIKQIFFVNRPRKNLSVSGECVWLFVKKLNELSQGNEDKKISLLETAVLRGYGDLSETIQSTQTRRKSNYKPNKNEVRGDEAWNSFMEEMQNEEINVDVISEKTAYEELPF